MALLKILLSLLIIFFPIGEIGRLQFSNGVSVSINDILLFLTVFFWGVYRLTTKKAFPDPFLKKPIILFIFIAFVSLILNVINLNTQSFFVSLLYLVRWAFYASLYFVLFDFDKKFKKIISYLLLFSGFLVVLVGYIQYFLYPDLKNLYYLGWDEHLYRMFSGFLDPNFAGAFFVIYFIFSLNFLKDSVQRKKYFQIIIYGFISVISFLAILLTYSRSALIMLFLSLGIYLVMIRKGKLLILFSVLLMLLIFVSPKSFQTEGTNLLRSVSSEARIQSMQQGITIFEKSPVFGIGFNAYRYAQNKYLGLNNIYWQTTHSGAGTDNSFLFVLATTGVVGFAAYLFLLFRLFKLAKKNLKNNFFSLILFSSLAGLILNSLFINSLFYVFILEWVWILASLTENS